MIFVILCLVIIAAGAAMGFFTSTLLLFGIAANITFKVICAVCKIGWRSACLVYRFVRWCIPTSRYVTRVTLTYLDDVILGVYVVSLFAILRLEALYVEHEVRNRKR